jgi:glycosyltransferase involved in cell wall biosynthesis
LDGVFGPNVPPDHPEELAQTLEKLASSPDLMPKYGRAAGSFIKQFETGRVLDSFEESLRSVLKEG